MNKRAKKRLKEAVQKDIAGLANKRKEQGSAPPPAEKLPESRGFTSRPEKKRG